MINLVIFSQNLSFLHLKYKFLYLGYLGQFGLVIYYLFDSLIDFIENMVNFGVIFFIDEMTTFF